MNIDWDESKSEILLNPRMPPEEKRIAEEFLSAVPYPGHVWLATSGTSKQKWVALSKKALLASAQAVIIILECTSKDIWLNPLPLFHVGGLGIRARGYLSGAKVEEMGSDFIKWDYTDFP